MSSQGIIKPGESSPSVSGYGSNDNKKEKEGGEIYKAGELKIGCAMFVCGGPVLDVLADIGINVSDAARQQHEMSVKQLKSKASRLRDIALDPVQAGWQKGIGLWDMPERDDTCAIITPTSFPPQQQFQNYEKKVGIEVEECSNNTVSGLDLSDANTRAGRLRISIPTVHVCGRKDPRRPASLQLAALCDAKQRKFYDHGGGHEIPRRSEVSRKLAKLMQWMDEAKLV